MINVYKHHNLKIGKKIDAKFYKDNKLILVTLSTNLV